MQILFITSEVAPYSNAGQVGQVCASLSKALHGLGHTVTVLSPLYKGVDPAVFSLARRLSPVQVRLDSRTFACELYDGRTASGVNLLFLGSREHFSELTPGLTDNTEQAVLRAAIFSQAAIEIAKTYDPPSDVLHAHDWLAAVAAYSKREAFEALRRRVMRIDHSWERSARRYDILYKNLAEI
jgi:glycogen synthase